MSSLGQFSIVQWELIFFFLRLVQACLVYGHAVSFITSCVRLGKVKFCL